MFSADCDQCGARNKLPASAQEEGINSGSLIPCPSCGAEVCVRLAADSGDSTVTAPLVMAIATEAATPNSVPREESGEDEATQVLEPNALPDADAVPTSASQDEPEPATARRANNAPAEAVPESAQPISLIPLESSELLESSPDSLMPLSSRDFLPEGENKPERHLPVPPVREVHAESSDEPPVSFGTPTLAALVRKATPPPPRDKRGERDDDERMDDVLMPPAGPIDELWDARVLPLLRPPTATEAPVASVSRPPEPPKEQPRSNGALGFALLVAGVAFVAGLAVKSSKDSESAAPAIPAAAPLAEAPAVAPLPTPALEQPSMAPAAPSLEQPSETPAEALPPPALAAPEPQNKPTTPNPAVVAEPTPRPADAAPKSTPQAAPLAPAQNTPRTTVAPVRSATVATDSPPAEVAFNSDATAAALSAAAQRASSCKRPTDPSGVAVVTITFAPTGRVTSANISGPPFAGTETGSCIASVLRGVKVPAYSGDFMTVKKTIQVE